MTAKYRKIDPRIWDDEKFSTLSPECKLIALYCLTCSQANRIGIFRFSPALAAEQLETLPEPFRKGFLTVVAEFKWGWDESKKVLYFPTWWKYNPPESANVLIGNLSDLHSLPDTPLKEAFLANTTYLQSHYRKRVGKAWRVVPVEQILGAFAGTPRLSGNPTGNPSGNPTPNHTCNPTPNHKAQEQEQEQEQEPPIGGVAKESEIESLKADPEDPPGLVRFWSAYPPKGRERSSKKKCREVWKRAKLERLTAEILAGLAAWKLSDKWTREQGRYIEAADRWLREEKWRDIPQPAQDPVGSDDEYKPKELTEAEAAELFLGGQ